MAPNRLAAEIPTRTGRNMNGAADISWIMSDRPLMAGLIWTRDLGPNRPGLVKKLFKAISKPPATRAGMIGTKMSLKSLMKAMTGLTFLPLAAIFFKSSVETSDRPVCLINSL